MISCTNAVEYEAFLCRVVAISIDCPVDVKIRKGHGFSTSRVVISQKHWVWPTQTPPSNMAVMKGSRSETIQVSSYRIRHRDTTGSQKNSQVVSLHVLQYDHSRTLQLQCTRYLGRDEQSRCWRGTITTPCQRRQCAHLLSHGCELLF